MNVTISPFGGWLDYRPWFALAVLACLLQSWVLMGKAWRRDPPGFIWRTFTDERGVPDGKLVAACHAVALMTFETIVCTLLDRWPPYYVWITWDFIAIAGIFGSVYVSKKYYDAGGSTLPPTPPLPPPSSPPQEGGGTPPQEGDERQGCGTPPDFIN